MKPSTKELISAKRRSSGSKDLEDIEVPLPPAKLSILEPVYMEQTQVEAFRGEEFNDSRRFVNQGGQKEDPMDFQKLQEFKKGFLSSNVKLVEEEKDRKRNNIELIIPPS